MLIFAEAFRIALKKETFSSWKIAFQSSEAVVYVETHFFEATVLAALRDKNPKKI